MQGGGMDGWMEGKKEASIPLTSSDVMLMQIFPAGCERRRGGERDAEKKKKMKLLSTNFSHPSAGEDGQQPHQHSLCSKQRINTFSRH